MPQFDQKFACEFLGRRLEPDSGFEEEARRFQYRRWLLYYAMTEAFDRTLPGAFGEDGKWRVPQVVKGTSENFAVHMTALLSLDFSSEWRDIHARKSFDELLDTLKGLRL